jgi:hypothetical protein
VFVCRDDERLYFGMRCAADPTGPLQSRNNLVRYDRTRPVGEDLVEIVLDPSNGGTGSTGDLYHLVIKTNGAVVSERGIGWHPPTGPRRVWSADVRVAVSPVRDGVWLIEGSVPFAAFDAEALRRGVWGVDFARLQPRLGAYTCWSGARWHLYRPRGLGNMNMAW